MRNRTRVAVAGLVMVALGLGLTAGVVFAQPSPPQPDGPMPAAGQPMNHEPMHRMMDAMHDAGASERMHEAMGDEGERLLEQCAAMMAMPGMMGR